MNTAYIINFLRNYNEWRRGGEQMQQPAPAEIGNVIDAACDELEAFRDLKVAYEQNSQQCVQLNRDLKRATDAMGSEFTRSDFELAAAAKRESELRSDLTRVADELKAAKDWILTDSKTIGQLRADLARVTAQRDEANALYRVSCDNHARTCTTLQQIEAEREALRARVAELESQRDAMEQDRDSWQLGCASKAIDVRDLKRDIEAISAGRDYFKAISEAALKREDEHVVTIRRLEQRNAELVAALEKINTTLSIPAAEYVPAIREVFDIIDAAMKEARHD